VGTVPSKEDRERALERYAWGMDALEHALRDDGGREAQVEAAIAHLNACLDHIARHEWSCLWAEAQRALGDAYMYRDGGDPLQNARFAAACYRKALDACLEDGWDWLGTLD
jgi:hypothetical protein